MLKKGDKAPNIFLNNGKYASDLVWTLDMCYRAFRSVSGSTHICYNVDVN